MKAELTLLRDLQLKMLSYFGMHQPSIFNGSGIQLAQVCSRQFLSPEGTLKKKCDFQWTKFRDKYEAEFIITAKPLTPFYYSRHAIHSAT